MLFARYLLLSLAGVAVAAPATKTEDEKPLVAAPQVMAEEAVEYEEERQVTL